MAKSSSVLRIRQVRSKIGQERKQREALRTLGLHRIGQVVERPDNPGVRGTVRFIGHLVRVESEPAATPRKAAAPAVKKPVKKATKTSKKKTAKTSAASTAAAAKGPTTSKVETATKKKTSKKKASGGKS